MYVLCQANTIWTLFLSCAIYSALCETFAFPRPWIWHCWWAIRAASDPRLIANGLFVIHPGMDCVIMISSFYRAMLWTNRAGFWHVSFLPPVLHTYTMLKGNSVISKNKGTSLWNFVLKSGLRKFRHGISITETCYQLSSRKVNAQSVINWAVVGQLSR